MGFATGYVAVKDLSPEEILTRLGATLGETVAEPDLSTAPTCVAPATNGWTVIGDSAHNVWDEPDHLTALSKGTTLVTAYMEEHDMYAHAELYRDGRRVWRVVSESGEDPQLSTEGTPPESLARLAQEAEAEDPDVDHLFEVPFALVTEATGNEVDGGCPWPESGFRELLFQ
ncbi:hypothetical protein [Actinomadura hibisca]|uniref:hypothetical protein n=1 Tax=Actinomadura hibisca TaxID=68565 RepID=UPI00082F5750|nr:hypothetical protein [Actinomadura hibisca]